MIGTEEVKWRDKSNYYGSDEVIVGQTSAIKWNKVEFNYVSDSNALQNGEFCAELLS